MARLTWIQILIAIAVGALFASLQRDLPVRALEKLSVASCVLPRQSC